MKTYILPILFFLVWTLPVICFAEWQHTTPRDVAVTHARFHKGTFSLSPEVIDIIWQEGRIQRGNEGCFFVPLNEATRTFAGAEFYELLGWLPTHIGEGFTLEAEKFLAEKLGDDPQLVESIATICGTAAL